MDEETCAVQSGALELLLPFIPNTQRGSVDQSLHELDLMLEADPDAIIQHEMLMGAYAGNSAVCKIVSTCR